jgi:predicted nucleic acid-binding protein
MLAEFADVTSREEFAEIGKARAASFMAVLARRAIIVPVKHIVNLVEEDPDDNIVLSTALRGNASQIVSGDKHLLELRRYRGVKRLTVDEMLESVQDPLQLALSSKKFASVDPEEIEKTSIREQARTVKNPS